MGETEEKKKENRNIIHVCPLTTEGGSPLAISYTMMEYKIRYSQLCLSQIRISQIITQVEGLFKSSSLYILLFITPHKSKFL